MTSASRGVALAGCWLLLSFGAAWSSDLKVTITDPPPANIAGNVESAPSPEGDEAVYDGRLRVYLVEPLARWTDNDGWFYENALLDFPIVEDISLSDGEVQYWSTTWNAAGTRFDMITDDNIRAIAVVSKETGVVMDADPGSGYYFSAHFADVCAEADPGVVGHHETAPGFTHKVFIEEATAKSCGYCPDARAALASLQASGNFLMTHVALVRDLNPTANAYVLDFYVTPTPTVFFDGGSEVMMGGGTNMVPYYTPLIQDAGLREVPPLDIVTAIEWIGDYYEEVYAVRIHVAVSNNVAANSAPAMPGTPGGPTVLSPDEAGNFVSSSVDPEGNLLYFQWDWGNGTLSEWSDPVYSGMTSTSDHSWTEKGVYDVRVRVKDPFGEETAWSAPLSVTVNCCQGKVGDSNGSGDEAPTIGDISVLIDAKFVTTSCDGLIECLAEADVNLSGGIAPTCDDITIGDISMLIDYLFVTGPEAYGPLPDCP